MSINLKKTDSFYATLKMKIVSAGIRTTDLGLYVELSKSELFDLLI